MKRRWFIRGLFMLPILFCVSGWGVSTCYRVRGSYTHDGSTLNCGLYYGMVGFGEERRAWLLSPGSPWEGSYDRYPFHVVDTDFWWRSTSIGNLKSNGRTEFSLVGFQYVCQAVQYGPDDPLAFDWTAAVPFWFLMAGSGTVLIFVWRKTGKPKFGRAFPVELATPNAEQVGKAS